MYEVLFTLLCKRKRETRIAERSELWKRYRVEEMKTMGEWERDQALVSDNPGVMTPTFMMVTPCQWSVTFPDP